VADSTVYRLEAEGDVSLIRQEDDGSVTVARYRAERVTALSRSGPGSYVAVGPVRPQLN
jgi:hypothetical protein